MVPRDLMRGFDRAIFLEPISKKWIRVQGKARFGEKAEHTR
jgi:hypothetical protein